MTRSFSTTLIPILCASAFAAPGPFDVVAGSPQELLQLEGDVGGTHDPVVIRERGTYYVFITGGRSGPGIIPIKTSSDLRTGKNAGHVMPALPEWAPREMPERATPGRRTSPSTGVQRETAHDAAGEAEEGGAKHVHRPLL